MRLALMGALRAFPEAAQAAAAVLHQIEAKDADDITAEAQRAMFDVTPGKAEAVAP
jgi:hypothetical protein